MSTDNIIYVQKCADGQWRAWEQCASSDPERPSSDKLIITHSNRADAFLAVHDWYQENPTEYGVFELHEEDDYSAQQQAKESKAVRDAKCTVCKTEWVDVMNGEDTCDACRIA